MREIPLTHGRAALVDDDDYERVNQYNWFYHKQGYAFSTQLRQYMHRFLMNAQPGQEVDHANRNRLDNRKENLRLASDSQQRQNSRKRRNRTATGSRFKGVYRNKGRGRPWQAKCYLTTAGIQKQYHLGGYSEEHHAALAYDAQVRQLYGEYASLNFPNIVVDPLLFMLWKRHEPCAAKLTTDQVKEIRRLHQEGHTGMTISNRLHIPSTTIYNIIKGRTWKNV